MENITHTADNAEINYGDMKDPREFQVRPVEDWIIVERIYIKSIQEKKGSALNIKFTGGVAPSNIMDIERQKAEQNVTYEQAETEFLKKWDEHPTQGTVKAIGPGRPLEEGVIVPIPVKVGDHIYLRGRTGEPIVVNKKLYWMHKAHEVFAVVKK
jgi:co-chaperonin GroES (HSP10)